MTHMRLFPNARLARPELCPAMPNPTLPTLTTRGLLGTLLPLIVALSACTTRTPPAPPAPPAPALPALQPVASLPGFAADPLDGLRTALAQQCTMTRPPAEWVGLCASLPQAAVSTPEAL